MECGTFLTANPTCLGPDQVTSWSKQSWTLVTIVGHTARVFQHMAVTSVLTSSLFLVVNYTKGSSQRLPLLMKWNETRNGKGRKNKWAVIAFVLHLPLVLLHMIRKAACQQKCFHCPHTLVTVHGSVKILCRSLHYRKTSTFHLRFCLQSVDHHTLDANLGWVSQKREGSKNEWSILKKRICYPHRSQISPGYLHFISEVPHNAVKVSDVFHQS